MPTSALLYHNPEDTVFVVDIPTSIKIAQDLSPLQTRRVSEDVRPPIHKNKAKKHLLSSTPLTTPYVLSTEPKTKVARARVLERIPHSEQVYHADIVVPFVRAGLNDILTSQNMRADWCLPRRLEEKRTLDDEKSRNKKRKLDDCQPGQKIKSQTSMHEQQKPTQSRLICTSVSESLNNPPLILAPGVNHFASLSEVSNLVVRNTSSDPSTIQTSLATERISASDCPNPSQEQTSTQVPPLSSFILCQIPLSQEIPGAVPTSPIPGLALERKFNLILLDPPWHNRSVRRSHHYKTHSYRDGDMLTQRIGDILRGHLYDPPPECTAEGTTSASSSERSVAAIWITNSAKARATAYDALRGAGLCVREEWVWVKTTTNGEPITQLDGLWRKPYEVLVIGERACNPGHKIAEEHIVRRLIAAVPDVHSRKPNLRELFERVFFASSVPAHKSANETERGYSALEVFARNLTAGWWACGDEALKFNEQGWWTED